MHMFKAGLFSAVAAVSLVESYKFLSPDSAADTVTLLTQISQQLVDISNGRPLKNVESSQPFRPTNASIMINVMWFSSIVLCLAGSVFATLIQQSARQYQALTKGCPIPQERARLRTLLFNGIGKFKMDQVRQMLAMSMHLSIVLYCVGFLIYIFVIGKFIGLLALLYLLFFYLIYAVFTFTPIFFLDSPFGTPFTPLFWRLFHLCLLGIFWTLRGIVDRVHTLSKVFDSGSKIADNLSNGPKRWRETFNARVKMHRQWFFGGRQRSVEFYATVAPPSVDENTLEWILATFLERDSEKDLKDFAAWTREYFHKSARSDPAKAISEEPLTNPIYGFRLRHLLKKCIPENSGLTEEHKRRLRVGLECLWHWVWAYNQNSEPFPPRFHNDVPGTACGTDMTGPSRTEQDPIADMIGRCFGGLLTKKLAANLNSCHCPDGTIGDTSDVEACPPCAHKAEVETLLTKPDDIGSEINTDTENVPPEVLKIFRTTVDILAEELTIPVAEFMRSPKLRPEASAAAAAASLRKIHSEAQQRLQASIHQGLLDKLNQISQELFPVSGATPLQPAAVQ